VLSEVTSDNSGKRRTFQAHKKFVNNVDWQVGKESLTPAGNWHVSERHALLLLRIDAVEYKYHKACISTGRQYQMQERRLLYG